MTVPSPRLRWSELPLGLREALENLLGAPVAADQPQTGGFSPGLASRLTLADGCRVFVKAINSERNPQSPDLYRREASVMAVLPAAVPAPRLRASYDDGDWIALVLDGVDGHHPAQPWRPGELHRVMDALADLARRGTPCPPDLPDIRDDLAENFRSWQQLAWHVDPESLGPWVAEHIDLLVDLEYGWAHAAEGQSLVHADLRADNILLTRDGVAFIDWPYAVRGAPWIDLPLLLVSVAATTPAVDPEATWIANPLGTSADPHAVTAVLAAVAGDLTARARQPAPVNIPRLRAHQQRRAEAALAWLRRRIGTITGHGVATS